MSAQIPREEWEWFGNAGHLIVAHDCRFHLCTLVGPWVVSTVGQWLPDSGSWDIFANSKGVTLTGRGDDRRNQFLREVGYVEIGAGRTFETMVFEAGERCTNEGCDCGMPMLKTASELDSDAYNDAGSATRGHYAMCEKWAQIEPADAERVASAWQDVSA